ncbi:hypothetical protein TWF696_007475 [Orbilia brochopaga]|uniref:Uncharacterized protein n=1 Tax=Orbilia brochopaga TaxID=3140254 RepID=A0AAV9UML7_9PEZI
MLSAIFLGGLWAIGFYIGLVARAQDQGRPRGLAGSTRINRLATMTSTVVITVTERSTIIPTITLEARQYCAEASLNLCTKTSSLDLCTNVLQTWNPFPPSSVSSSSTLTRQTLTTATTATSATTLVTSSSVPTPSNLFTLGASNTDAIDIDPVGNMILRNSVARIIPAFALNSDGTITSYGSGFSLFVDFGNTLSIRDLNTVYGLGFCYPAQRSLNRRSHSGMGRRRIGSLFARQNSGTAYATFSLNGRVLTFSTGGSTYGFANCIANIISIFDIQSNAIPNACRIIALTAFSVPTASYGQYYSLGLRSRSQFANIATCRYLPATSTGAGSSTEGTDIDTYSVPSELPTETDTGIAADFTSPTDPFPVFLLSIYELGSVLLDINGSHSLVIGNANDTHFNAFQLTADSGMILYGANFPIYANTSVELINSGDKRAICYENPIVLIAADPDELIPEGSTTGPFITDPDIGLMLIGWQFIACDGSSLLQLVFFGCPISSECFIVNPGLFALYGLNRDQALYNGAVVRQQVLPVPTMQSLNPPVTSEVVETDAAQFARNFFIEGGYFDFCSSELGYYSTSTIVETETTLALTETTESTTTVGIVDYSSTVVETVTTGTIDLTTTTTTLPFVSFFVVTSRLVVWRTTTIASTTVTGTRTFTITYYPATEVTTLTTLTIVSTTPRRRRDIDSTVFKRMTQSQDLTPTELQFLDPSIIELGCSAFFTVMLDEMGVTPTTYTYLTDITTTVDGVSTSYTSTITSYASTSYNVVGTETSFVYTETLSTTDISTRVNVDYRYTTRRVTTTVTDNVLYRVDIESAETTTVTDGTTTTTVFEPGTMVLCPPSQVSPAGLMVSGVSQPFQNFTQPAFYTNPNTPGQIGYAYWGQMPADYPDSPIVAYARAAKNESVYAWLRQDFRMCPGSTYYLRVMYKWLYNQKTPQDVFNRSADYSALGYGLNGFQVVVSGMPAGEGSFYASAVSDNGPAAKGDASSAGASSFTSNFTARYTNHLVSLIFYWRDPNTIPRLIDSPYKFNQLYVYNLQVQSTPFTS